MDLLDLAEDHGIRQEPGAGELVWLAWDPVVTQPWEEFRLWDALEKLSRGPAGPSERWRFDPPNHQILLWLPMRLAEVWNGMHTVAAGMLNNTGVVRARAIYDLSPLYERLTQPTVWGDTSENGVFWKKDGGPAVSIIHNPHQAILCRSHSIFFQAGCLSRACTPTPMRATKITPRFGRENEATRPNDPNGTQSPRTEERTR